MGDTFIFIMGLVCTGAVFAATFLSINELKDVNEPQIDSMDMADGAKRHLKLISTAVLIIIGFVSVGLFCFYLYLPKWLKLTHTGGGLMNVRIRG